VETLQLARQLIARPSVTPDDGGSIEMIADRLAGSGFDCVRLDRGSVRNLWARRGRSAPLVCLAGHVDVVPPGPLDRWRSDPFEPTERDGRLYGRGAADMKTSVAAMVVAAERVVAANRNHAGSIALLLTSDEEGDAVDGTVAVVDWLRNRNETIDACIVGEPTSAARLGDTVKNGRRGSLNGVLRVRGVQGHIAYVLHGCNPIHTALPALAELTAVEWDRGNEYFPPTTFQLSNIQAGTGANNVTPGEMEVLFNFRFSPESTVELLEARVHEILDRHRVNYELAWTLSGSPFMTKADGVLVDALTRAIYSITGVTPELSTSGGTSDGRFIATVAREVVEFGPRGEAVHGVDERVHLTDIEPLTAIYQRAVAALLR
jgi:succinyl-diaminopimelate desuccinylase